jgi:small subunit ribosomal protein S9
VIDEPEDQPAPDAEPSTPDVPEAPPEAEATGDASEASKVEADDGERPAPPARAKDPEGEPTAPETQPIGQGEPDAEAEEAAPRAKPEIPGADLEPDIVLDSDAVRGREEGGEYGEDETDASGDGEPEDTTPQTIAGATIDLGRDARYRATGKRKTAVARVILKPGTGAYVINGKTLDEFFPRPTLQRVIRQPLETVGYESRMDVVAAMHGGGVSAQAGALRHGVARALIEADPNLRGELKRRGFLTRDPRVKERKKAGLKKARKRPQFSKR